MGGGAGRRAVTERVGYVAFVGSVPLPHAKCLRDSYIEIAASDPRDPLNPPGSRWPGGGRTWLELFALSLASRSSKFTDRSISDRERRRVGCGPHQRCAQPVFILVVWRRTAALAETPSAIRSG